MRLVRALGAKKVRRERRLLVAEGEDLLAAALDHGVRPVAMLVDSERMADDDPLLRRTDDIAERYRVPADLLAAASGLAAPPRVLAVLPQPPRRGFRDVSFPPSLAVFLAGVADPGNVGTLVRTAAGMGCDWLALGPGSADPFGPRAVRAAMGSTWSVPILEGVSAADLATRGGFAIVAAVPGGGAPPWQADLTRPLVLALGAERAGLAPAMEALAGAGAEVVPVTIPQAPGTESLNVAAAAAALLYEAARQRAARGASSTLPGR